MLNDRLTLVESRVDDLEDKAYGLEDTVDALKEIVKYHDMKEDYGKDFDKMFDSPLETLEEIFKI